MYRLVCQVCKTSFREHPRRNLVDGRRECPVCQKRKQPLRAKRRPIKDRTIITTNTKKANANEPVATTGGYVGDAINSTAKKNCTATSCPICKSKCQAGSTDSGFITNNGACLRCCFDRKNITKKEAIPGVGDTSAADAKSELIVDSVWRGTSRHRADILTKIISVNVSEDCIEFLDKLSDGSHRLQTTDIDYFLNSHKLVERAPVAPSMNTLFIPAYFLNFYPLTAK